MKTNDQKNSRLGRKTPWLGIAGLAFFIVAGCTGSMGNTAATDPTERGLSYIAAAIVTSAIIRAFFNK